MLYLGLAGLAHAGLVVHACIASGGCGCGVRDDVLLKAHGADDELLLVQLAGDYNARTLQAAPQLLHIFTECAQK